MSYLSEMWCRNFLGGHLTDYFSNYYGVISREGMETRGDKITLSQKTTALQFYEKIPKGTTSQDTESRQLSTADSWFFRRFYSMMQLIQLTKTRIIV